MGNWFEPKNTRQEFLSNRKIEASPKFLYLLNKNNKLNYLGKIQNNTFSYPNDYGNLQFIYDYIFRYINFTPTGQFGTCDFMRCDKLARTDLDKNYCVVFVKRGQINQNNYYLFLQISIKANKARLLYVFVYPSNLINLNQKIYPIETYQDVKNILLRKFGDSVYFGHITNFLKKNHELVIGIY